MLLQGGVASMSSLSLSASQGGGKEEQKLQQQEEDEVGSNRGSLRLDSPARIPSLRISSANYSRCVSEQ